MDTGYKIYAEWLRTRLEKEMNEKISIEQNTIRIQKRKRNHRNNLCDNRNN